MSDTEDIQGLGLQVELNTVYRRLESYATPLAKARNGLPTVIVEGVAGNSIGLYIANGDEEIRPTLGQLKLANVMEIAVGKNILVKNVIGICTWIAFVPISGTPTVTVDGVVSQSENMQ